MRLALKREARLRHRARDWFRRHRAAMAVALLTACTHAPASFAAYGHSDARCFASRDPLTQQYAAVLLPVCESLRESHMRVMIAVASEADYAESAERRGYAHLSGSSQRSSYVGGEYGFWLGINAKLLAGGECGSSCVALLKHEFCHHRRGVKPHAPGEPFGRPELCGD